MKKFVVIVLCLLVSVGLFAGGKSDSSGGTITLNLWHLWPADTDAQKVPLLNAIRSFEAAYPNIKLVVDGTENNAYGPKVRSAMAAGETPDVFFWWAGGKMETFALGGTLLNLNSYLNDGTKDKLLARALDNVTFNGNVYALPYSQVVGLFYVNQELFDQNGLKVPTNWDELVSVCKAFVAKGITPFAVGGKEAWCVGMYYDLIGMRQAGYTATNAALTKTGPFNTPDFLEAARKLQELVDIGAFGRGYMGLSRDEAEVPFYEGKVPMYVNGSWIIGNIMRQNSKVRDKIKVYPFPVMGPNSNLYDFTGGVADMVAVGSATKHKDESVLLAKYLAEHFATELYVAGAALPAWDVKVDTSRIDPLTLGLIDLTRKATSYTLWWNTNLASEDAVLYQDTVQALLAKQVTPRQFVDTMQTISNRK